MTSALATPTLVLNKNWLAIGVNTVQDAISKVYAGGAEVVDPHQDIHGVRFQTYTWDDWRALRIRDDEGVVWGVDGPVRAPDIIALTRYDKLHSRTVQFNRRNLFARDNNTCQYCGARPGTANLSVEHVIPQCQGGRSTWENCVLACITCNVRKGGRTPRQAGMVLLRKPVKPKWSPTFRTKLIKPTWE